MIQNKQIRIKKGAETSRTNNKHIIEIVKLYLKILINTLNKNEKEDFQVALKTLLILIYVYGVYKKKTHLKLKNLK